jgi:hypothetical protein
VFWPKIALTRLSRLGYLRLQVTQRMTKPAAYQAPSGGQTPLGRVVGGVLVVSWKRVPRAGARPLEPLEGAASVGALNVGTQCGAGAREGQPPGVHARDRADGRRSEGGGTEQGVSKGRYGLGVPSIGAHGRRQQKLAHRPGFLARVVSSGRQRLGNEATTGPALALSLLRPSTSPSHVEEDSPWPALN